MSYAELAEEYENNGKEQEAIACYQKVYEEDFATMEGICIPESREYAAKSIAEIYRKKGDIDRIGRYLHRADWNIKRTPEIAKSQTVCHSIKAKDGSCTGKCV